MSMIRLVFILTGIFHRVFLVGFFGIMRVMETFQVSTLIGSRIFSVLFEGRHVVTIQAAGLG